MKWLFWTAGAFLLGFIVLFLVGNGLIFIVEVPWLVLFGWWSFLQGTLPAVRPDAPSIFTAIAALGPLLGGLHVAGRRLMSITPATQARRWQLRWTVASTSLLLLTFTAGIAIVGTVHNAAWIVFGQQPLIVHPLWLERVHAQNQLQTISTLLTQESSRRDDTLPPAGELNANAQPMHSLLTTLLPHLGDESQILVSQIDWSKPWNHPDNKRAFSTAVEEYQLNIPNRPQATAPLPDGYAVASYAANQHVFRFARPLQLESITDGLSTTIFFGQVTESPSAWGDPLNLRDPARGINGDPRGYSGPEDRACFLFGDSSVRALSKDTAPEILRALSTPAGGEHVSGF